MLDAAGAMFGFEGVMEATPGLVAQGRGPSRLGVEFVADEPQVCKLDWAEVRGYVGDHFGWEGGEVCGGHFWIG